MLDGILLHEWFLGFFVALAVGTKLHVSLKHKAGRFLLALYHQVHFSCVFSEALLVAFLLLYLTLTFLSGFLVFCV